MDIIGAGPGRTGTTSLKQALDILGIGPVYHTKEIFREPRRLADWETVVHGGEQDRGHVFDGYRATVHWPVTVHRSEVLRLYREPRGRTPSARVVRRGLRIARKQHSDDGTASVGTAHQLRMDISGFQQSPAGVGVSWYTWLEQGWAVTVSAGVLGAVARVLRLTPAERDHPYLFAGQPTRRVTRVTSTIRTVSLRNRLHGWSASRARRTAARSTR
ncbi:sulfotransferase [Streptomyces uncialis]|uniref:sulfotransferase n=1 Tax=Streptomyces uncialis TaxID=1048205 RepID=UPI0038636F98